MSGKDPSNNVNPSPLKGIDRISEEIRQERQKVNQLQQEKAKLKIEVETLKQSIETYKIEKDDLTNEIYNQKRALQDQKMSIESLQSEISFYQTTVQALEKEKKEVELMVLQQEDEHQLFQESMQQQKDEILTLQLKIDSYDKKLLSKDDLINSLKLELLNIRQSQLKFEKDNIQTMNELNTKNIQSEELSSKLEFIGELEKNLSQTKENNDVLYQELQKSLELNASYQLQIQESQQKLLEKQNKEKEFLATIDELLNEKDFLVKETHNLEDTIHQLTETLSIERDSSSTVKERSQSVQQNNSFLEGQVRELKDLYERVLQANVQLEENYNALKIYSNNMQEEVASWREKNQELESQLASMTSNQAMKSELDALRSQLQIMRKKLLQKDLEQESGIITSQQLMEREQQGRQVSRLPFLFSLSDRILTVRCRPGVREHHQRPAHRDRQDEPEVRRPPQPLQRAQRQSQSSGAAGGGGCDVQGHGQAHHRGETDVSPSLFPSPLSPSSPSLASVALNASEAVERNMKQSHENHHLLTTVHRLENEIKNYQSDCHILQLEINSLREKMKEFHNLQLQAERKSTELLSTNNKLQGNYDDLKQQHEILLLDLEKLRASYSESQNQVLALQQNLSIQERAVRDHESLTQRYQQSQQLLQQKEVAYYKELDLIKQQKELIVQELSSCQQSLYIKERTNEELNKQFSELRKAYEDLSSAKELLQQELMKIESQKNHEKLAELKNELQSTLSEFQEIEREKQMKQTVILGLTTNLEKEKEKNVLLSMQLNLLEEKVKVLEGELAVFRGLDVYHTSLQQELDLYRRHNPSASQAPAPANAQAHAHEKPADERKSAEEQAEAEQLRFLAARNDTLRRETRSPLKRDLSFLARPAPGPAPDAGHDQQHPLPEEDDESDEEVAKDGEDRRFSLADISSLPSPPPSKKPPAKEPRQTAAQFQAEVTRFHQLAAQQREAERQAFSRPVTAPAFHSPEQLLRERERPHYSSSSRDPLNLSASSSASSAAASLLESSQLAEQRAKRRELRERLLMEKIVLEERQKSANGIGQRTTTSNNNNNNPSSRPYPATSLQQLPRPTRHTQYSWDEADDRPLPVPSSRLAHSQVAPSQRPSSASVSAAMARSASSAASAYQRDPHYLADLRARGNVPETRFSPSRLRSSAHLLNQRLDLERARRLLNS